MTRFSANLGFLWGDLPLPAAIRAAAEAGFDAVECHWPYETAPQAVREALAETGLPMLGINTAKGGEGQFGLCALTRQEDEARTAIRQAVVYATEIGAEAVHAMAGMASGAEAHETFNENLRYACDLATKQGITILIESINTMDVPGYFLNTPGQATEMIERIGSPNLKLMFDCYHVARMGLDVLQELSTALPHLGHVQFASVPDRAEPDQGDLDYGPVFEFLKNAGYDRPLGAEYKPSGPMNEGLGWLDAFRTQPSIA